MPLEGSKHLDDFFIRPVRAYPRPHFPALSCPGPAHGDGLETVSRLWA